MSSKGENKVVVPNYGDLTVYVGFDSRNFGQMMAYETCRTSIVKTASQPVEVRQLIQKNLRARGIYYQPVDPKAATEFSLTRFLTPFLNQFKGWAVFCDSDFVWTDDVWKILDYARADPGKAVYCVHHNHIPKSGLKMNGLAQFAYPRKNWSSMMLFNCEHPSTQKLTVSAVNNQTPAWLHRMYWANDSEIGSIPHTYNYLVGHYYDHNENNLPKVIHWTDGGPWHPGYENCEFGQLWLSFLTEEEKEKIVAEREELRKEMDARLNKQ